jgi:hypothetical protein
MSQALIETRVSNELSGEPSERLRECELGVIQSEFLRRDGAGLRANSVLRSAC